MKDTNFDQFGRYILPDYTAGRPFSSFLPGIAGPDGIPLWAFYVNRGQAIASFGVESKDNPIMEFQPANKAYRDTHLTGFRTFIKINSADRTHVYEPFSAWTRSEKIVRRMYIGLNELEIEEIHADHGLQTNVRYYILPGEKFAGFVRQFTLTNHSNQTLSLEILDGLPVVIPFGVDNWGLKAQGRTTEAWMAVYNHEQGVPFYRLKASTEDSPEVEAIEAGHFALSFSVGDEVVKPLPSIVDPELVFGRNTALTTPDRFIEQPLETMLMGRQITSGKTPSGLFGFSTVLAPSKSTPIYSVFGHIGNEKHLAQHTARLYDAAFLETKRQQANELASGLTEAIETRTGSPVFDAYCRQTYLDNMLRGGWPILLGGQERPVIFHIYSRKHGDPERDYNAFTLAPEPYSQGEANYRDINQNRRCDVLFNPRVGDFNVRAFMSLIQADGYNPLVVKGVKYTLSPGKRAAILAEIPQAERLAAVLERPFTPGQLLQHIADHEIDLPNTPDDFLAAVLQQADHDFEAAHGEGYWVDHWTYNLDLIDSYLSVYPDRKNELLFGNPILPFYDSPAIVRPRAGKYLLSNGAPRQLEAVFKDPEKAALIASRDMQPHWVRTGHGQGAIYRTTLFGKLVTLAVIKFATLDPMGMGVEMEAGKPGWYDALNGLPGIFGSSMPETYAMQRLLTFLVEAAGQAEANELGLPMEVWNLVEEVLEQLHLQRNMTDPARDFEYWDAVSAARERYRAAVRLGFDGREHVAKIGDLAAALAAFLEKVGHGVQRAREYAQGVPLTYFSYRAAEYELIHAPQGEQARDEGDRPALRVKRFEPEPLALFLEGPVRALRNQPDQDSARALYLHVKASPLFDGKLQMYKVNASLDDLPHDIGRARAFTPGWLENESIWLHMEYKYLLEILKAELYEEFFEDFKNALIPFQDPARYGRCPLENSSFLVSSAHPDESLHGAGFVARLSGATAEFLSIWGLMMAGPQPFFVQDGGLHLRFRPALPRWLFTTDGKASFRFLGQCQVTYHNPTGADLLPTTPSTRISLILADGQLHTIDGPVIPPPYSELVRTGDVRRIEKYFA